MNPAYLQLLQSKGIQPLVNARASQPQKVQPLVNTLPINPQPALRPQGFGGHFEDTPPEFINTKIDNKIERLKKPPPTKKKKKRKSKK